MKVFHFEKIDRTREAERFLLDGGLIPKREVLGYRSNVEGVQSANASQLASGGSDRALDRTIVRLFVSGQQILMIINLLLAIAITSKDTLSSKKDVLEIVAKNSGKLKDGVTAMETLSAWLQASKNKDNLFPYVGNIFSNNKSEDIKKNWDDGVLLADRVADATNQEKYRVAASGRWSQDFKDLFLPQIEDYKNWLEEQKNNVDADKSQAKNSMQPISAGIVASYNVMKKTLKLMGSVRSLLARF